MPHLCWHHSSKKRTREGLADLSEDQDITTTGATEVDVTLRYWKRICARQMK
jgi:hypothetical protein